jgi:hypothetical protein
MRPATSDQPRRTRGGRERGMVTIVVVLFLIATVVFALAQMLDVSSGNVIDGQRQGDSAAAFFLAESGLERSRASVNAALAGTSPTPVARGRRQPTRWAAARSP